LAKVELRGTYFRNTQLQGHYLELSSSIINFSFVPVVPDGYCIKMKKK
jgi:hypothetical protein